MNLKFWKKEEKIEEIKNTPITPFQEEYKPESFQMQKEYTDKRDLDLINSKLDTIKAILANIDRRLEEIERIAKE